MNDPYKILGISQNSDDEQIKAAYKRLIKDDPGRLDEYTAAYDEIMNMRRGGGNSVYAGVRHKIQEGNYDEAEAMLGGTEFGNAEWYFLKGSICYGKGRLDEAYRNFTEAVRLDPSNSEYRSAFDHMSNGADGKMRGNPYDKSDHMGGVCTACDICQGMICLDCCCECAGGDCVPCC